MREERHARERHAKRHAKSLMKNRRCALPRKSVARTSIAWDSAYVYSINPLKFVRLRQMSKHKDEKTPHERSAVEWSLGHEERKSAPDDPPQSPIELHPDDSIGPQSSELAALR